MKIEIKVADILKTAADLAVLNLFKGEKKLSQEVKSVDQKLGGLITRAIQNKEFTGKTAEVIVFTTCKKIPAARVALVGLGKREKFEADIMREAAAAVIREAKKLKIGSIAALLDPAFTAAAVEGAVFGAYKFKGYKLKNESGGIYPRVFSVLAKNAELAKKIQPAIREAQILAGAQNSARDMVNSPANRMTPTIFSQQAKELARSNGLVCQVSDPRQLKMPAMLSVTAGSKQPPKVIILKYKHSPKAETIGLVGKGITFDSGGISLKSPPNLWEMKTDMAGAAAVLQIMGAAAKLKIKKNIIAVIPLCENMPDGGASRPGDVVSSHNGKTIEILSTDAEGRMVIVDALSYAKKLGATKLVDIATLTGGCIIALGDIASGILGNNKDMVEKIIAAGSVSGEKMWELPLFEEYKEYLKSEIADIKNCSGEGRGASPSTGALFIGEFIDGTPWAHIDIAGTAYLKKPRHYLGSGATGVTVRTLVKWLSS